jgi:hypothetical protein
MPLYSAALLCLIVLVSLIDAQGDSAIFSQFIGATTASGLSADYPGVAFAICTDYLRSLSPYTEETLPTHSSQLQQIMVEGVCQLCTSVEQSRVDSCCAQATSSACFDQFVVGDAAQTTPASALVTPTATPTGESSLAPISSPNGGVATKVCAE